MTARARGLPLDRAPSRLRRPLTQSSNLCFLSAWTQSLVVETVWSIPHIFRIMTVRGPPTVRFQAGHIPSWVRIVRALCAVAGRCWQPLATTVAVSRWSCSPSPRSPRRRDRALPCPAPPPNPTAAGPGDGRVRSSLSPRVLEPYSSTEAVALRSQAGLTGSGTHRYSYGGFGEDTCTST